MNYYILDNDEIVIFDIDRKRLQDTLLFKPELTDKEIQETEREIVTLYNKFVFADEHTDELLTEAKEKKLAELSKVTALFEDNLNKDMYFTSSHERPSGDYAAESHNKWSQSVSTKI